MEKACYKSMSNGKTGNDTGVQIIRHPSYYKYGKLTWFDMRVFYVRISNFVAADDSTPECLILNHIPLDQDTLLEINGSRCSGFSEAEPSLLRRHRADKITEEATFVSTDFIRLTGSVKFMVLYKRDAIISGVLEMSKSNGSSEESKNRNTSTWTINCNVVQSPGLEFFLKGAKQGKGRSDTIFPTIEVYVAGASSGSPIILTKTLPLKKKKNKMQGLDLIPEQAGGSWKNFNPGFPLLEETEDTNYRPESEVDNNNVMSWESTELADGEDGELTWFSAGVRVGVGLGLGICVGVGVGVGVLIRSYQSATRNIFRRRLFL